MDFYDKGGGAGSVLKPLGLSAAEKKALVEFLLTLSGDLVIGGKDPGPARPASLDCQRQELRSQHDDEIHIQNFTLAAAALLAMTVGHRGCRSHVPKARPPAAAAHPEGQSEHTRRKWPWARSCSGTAACQATVRCPAWSCHLPVLGWGDGGEISRGYPGTKHWRNSQTVLNSAYYNKLFWEGSVTSLEARRPRRPSGAWPATVTTR
jgi:hypothetical protein